MTGGKPPSDSEGLRTTPERGHKPPANALQRIGERYTVVELLGSGGMAAVYRVHDDGRGHDVALKQLTVSRRSSRTTEVTALFQREFHTLAHLSHPSVIEVYDYGVDPEGPYYTMELLEGGDLTQLAPLGYVRACEVLLQVCSSLSLVHSRRWVHRDVTPRNVRCTPGGGAKLIDFGAMVPMGARVNSLGTPAFTAPEVLRELPLDARADLFSLGATLYYALTGRLAFAARTFSELPEVWCSEPPPPSAIVPDIPEALDALVLSLLRIDPASRPRSAFEVMQRLAAISGTAEPEPLAVSRAYLATPALVGRDCELELFREYLHEAQEARGGALLFEGAPGVGRSRLLDACVLEGKALGATVLRLAGRAADQTALAGVRGLARDLRQTLPHVARERAQSSAEQQVPTRNANTALTLEPSDVLALLDHVCTSHTLLVVIDDVEHLDDASLGFLASFAHAAPSMRALLLGATDSHLAQDSASALRLLRADCSCAPIAALTCEQTEQLFSSVFGGAAHVGLLSDRVHKVAEGNPRESMALAQYLVDVDAARYIDGSWILPAELSLQNLPSEPGDRLRARLSGLPGLARQLLETQALSLRQSFTRAHYAELVPDVPARKVREAVDTLLREGLLANDEGALTLSSATLSGWLASQLTASETIERHAALAKAFQRVGCSGLHSVQHLLLAEQPTAALAHLNEKLQEHALPFDFQHHAQMSVEALASVLTRAHDSALQSGCPAQLGHETARQLIALSLVTRDKLHARYAPAFLTQLERDSGLSDFRVFAEEGEGSRLQRALQAAQQRYQLEPEHTRVYRPDQAIRYLCWYATLSIAIAARTRDAQLMASLAPLLEPFVSLGPLIHALWQNTISAYEMNFGGQTGRARTRAIHVFELLSTLLSSDHPYLDPVRNAIAFSVATIELSLGFESASRWIELLDTDPLQRVNGMYLRRLLCIYRGDTTGAEHYRRQAELLALQANARQMFSMPLRLELQAQVQLGDLAAVKHAADRIAERARVEPGWHAPHHYAQGLYQRMRGDNEMALLAFEQACLAAESKGDRAIWVAAAAERVSVMVELERGAEARSFGLITLEQCRERDIDVDASQLRRELALAEASCGDFDAAITRSEALIADRVQLMESHRALDYEVRARIALLAADPDAGEHIAKVAALQLSLGRGAAFLRRYPRLLEEARRANVRVSLLPTAFETSVLQPGSPPAASVLHSTLDFAARAQLALEQLTQASEARSARLYVAREGELVQVASHAVHEPSDLDDFASSCWRRLGASVDESTVPRSSGAREPTMWTDCDGTRYRAVFLPAAAGSTQDCIGLCALGNARASNMNSHALRQLAREIGAALVWPDDA